MAKMSRPIEYTEERIMELLEILNKYIDENEIPMVSEFCYKNNISRDTFYRIPQFSDTKKKLKEKQESQLAKAGLTNKVNVTMAIFMLKNNHGWTDRHELVNKNINMTIDNMSEEEAREALKKLESME
jgi:hypothetical protein